MAEHRLLGCGWLVGDEGVGGGRSRTGGREGLGLKPLVLAAPGTRLQRCWQHPSPARAAPASSTTTHGGAPVQQEPPEGAPQLLCGLQAQKAWISSTGGSLGAWERMGVPR